jgi:hypothetical protein
MGDAFSIETRDLMERSERAIAQSRDIVTQRHQIMAECVAANRRLELRLIFLREMANGNRNSVMGV